MKYNLNNEEKSYLKKIIINARNKYFEKNKFIDNEIATDWNTKDDNGNVMVNIKLDLSYELKTDEYISFKNFIEIFSDRKLARIYEGLNPKEKYILFLYYYLGYTDKQISKEISISADNVRITRNRIIKKLNQKYLGGN
jgi:RNA polymerase sigma factor (sigma-70 family)